MKYVIYSVFFSLSFASAAQSDVLDLKGRDLAVEALKKRDVSDTTYWKKGGVFGLNASQVSLTNWAGGGESSVSGAAIISLFSNYKKSKTNWDSSLDLGFGIVNQRGITFKSDDKIDLTSKYGHEAFKNWYYTGMMNFRSQFAPGYTKPGDSLIISRFMAPGYLLLSLGIDYKPTKTFNVFISPATAKLTFVADPNLANAGAFGVEKAVYNTDGSIATPGKNARYEVGGFLKLMFTTKIMENISFTTRADLFSNYLNEPGNIDINWETLLAMKVNKYITVNFTTHLIYDHDIKIAVDNNDDGVVDATGARTQFKQVLAVGFSYKF